MKSIAVDKVDHLMLSGNVVTTFFHYSIPWMLALVFSSSAGIVDGMFVGRYVGATGIAAINLVLPVFSLLIGLGLVLSVGGAVRYAKYVGENDPMHAKAIYTKSMVAIIMANLILQVFSLIFASEAVHFLGATGELFKPALLYFRILMCFGMLLPLVFAVSFFIRAAGHPILASTGLIAGALSNVVLDYLLIVHFELGIAGAAWATGASQLISLLILSLHFWHKDCTLRFTAKTGSWCELFHTFYNGSSEFISEISSGIMIFMYNRIIIERVGSDGVAAFSVVSYILMFGLLVIYGFSDSLAMLTSANMASGERNRVRCFLTTTLATVSGIGLLFFAILALFPKALAECFLPYNPEITEFTVKFINDFKWAFLFCGFNIAFSAYFTGLHRSLESLIISAARGIYVPVILILTLPPWLGNRGIFITTPLAEGLTFCLVLYLLFRKKSTNSRVKDPETLSSNV